MDECRAAWREFGSRRCSSGDKNVGRDATIRHHPLVQHVAFYVPVSQRPYQTDAERRPGLPAPQGTEAGIVHAPMEVQTDGDSLNPPVYANSSLIARTAAAAVLPPFSCDVGTI